MDSRLSQPKHLRRRVLGRSYMQQRDELIKGAYSTKSSFKGAFINKTSWLPDKTSKLEGKRGYMIAKSEAKSKERK